MAFIERTQGSQTNSWRQKSSWWCLLGRDGCSHCKGTRGGGGLVWSMGNVLFLELELVARSNCTILVLILLCMCVLHKNIPPKAKNILSKLNKKSSSSVTDLMLNLYNCILKCLNWQGNILVELLLLIRYIYLIRECSNINAV